MVTIRPKSNIEVLCNCCETKIGIIENGYFEPEDKNTDNFMRFRMYYIKEDGRPLNTTEYDVDLCKTCMKTIDPIFKKLKFDKSKVKRK